MPSQWLLPKTPDYCCKNLPVVPSAIVSSEPPILEATTTLPMASSLNGNTSESFRFNRR